MRGEGGHLVVAVVEAGSREGATSRGLFVEIILTVFLSSKVCKKKKSLQNISFIYLSILATCLQTLWLLLYTLSFIAPECDVRITHRC